MFLLSHAGATDTETIQADIEQAKERQVTAHQIAELVRSFGEDDSSPAIRFAKAKWLEQNDLLTNLYQQYEEAEQQEALQAALEAEQAAREAEQKARGTYIGRFRISHYCPCSRCNGVAGSTAIGARMTPWYTAAVDPSVIPLRSVFQIDGYGTFQAQDTGGAIRGNRIDVCVDSHAEAMRLGVVYRDVYIK